MHIWVEKEEGPSSIPYIRLPGGCNICGLVSDVALLALSLSFFWVWAGPYLIDYIDDLLDDRRGCYMVLAPVCMETMEQVCMHPPAVALFARAVLGMSDKERVRAD